MSSYACCHVDESTLSRSAKYAFHDAAEAGDVDGMHAMLEPPVDLATNPAALLSAPFIDLNGRDNTSCTPLQTAVLFKRLDVVRMLISRGAKLSPKCNGSPLLHVVLAMASLPANRDFAAAVLSDVLAAGVDVSSTDDLGRTCLHIAALHGLTEAARAIRAAPGAAEKLDLAGTDRTGASALHTAAEARQCDMVEWLVSLGASVNAVDKVGDTPAHAASKAGWLHGAALLQGKMANPQAHNAAGLTVELVFSPLHETSPSCPPCTTLIVTHEDCHHHHTCAPPLSRDSPHVPPENTARLDVLLNPQYGTLRAQELVGDGSRARIIDRAPPAKLSDVLRVHEYEYVRRILHAAGSAGAPPQPEEGEGGGHWGLPLPSPTAGGEGGVHAQPAHDPRGIHLIDADTAVSRGSWPAALRAAGAVCAAIDAVVGGSCRTAFCPVRPPGHHAGPTGVVPSEKDPDGSHGFCLLNNVAVGAAYAVSTYGRRGGDYAAEAGLGAGGEAGSGRGRDTKPILRRVAIFDFDVHHGNGTEAILRNLAPHEVMSTVTLPFARAAVGVMSYKPWLDEGDGGNVMFISSHGYGTRWDDDGRAVPHSVFYPGSGRSTGWDVHAVERLQAEANAGASWPGSSARSASSMVEPVTPFPTSRSGEFGDTGLKRPVVRQGDPTPLSALASPRTAVASAMSADLVSSAATPLPPPHPTLQPTPIPETLYECGVSQPHIVNVGMPHSAGPRAWRRAMVMDVLPRLADFKPDIILVSAGFDAHKSDEINSGYIRLAEDDYAWITRQLVKVANTTAHGRVVSVLEGGYKVQGRIVSPFARSVAAHVRALSSGIAETWDTERERGIMLRELMYEMEETAKENAGAEAARARAAAEGGGGDTLRTPRSTTAAGSSGDVHMNVGSSSTAELLGPVAGEKHGLQSPSHGEGGGGGSTARSKRRRAEVDYSALNAQLEAEKAAAAARAAGQGNASS